MRKTMLTGTIVLMFGCGRADDASRSEVSQWVDAVATSAYDSQRGVHTTLEDPAGATLGTLDWDAEAQHADWSADGETTQLAVVGVPSLQVANQLAYDIWRGADTSNPGDEETGEEDTAYGCDCCSVECDADGCYCTFGVCGCWPAGNCCGNGRCCGNGVPPNGY